LAGLRAGDFERGRERPLPLTPALRPAGAGLRDLALDFDPDLDRFPVLPVEAFTAGGAPSPAGMRPLLHQEANCSGPGNIQA
jgi:hypothetical protein